MSNSVLRFSCDAGLEGVFPPPVPALKKAPAFYKAIQTQSSNDPQSSTVKRCVPFLDALAAGVILPLWADVHVVASGGELSLKFPNSFPQAKSLEQHGYQQMPGHPLADQPYGKLFMKFINPWVIETEPGWSCLFTSPLNHFERRIKILDGVVDTDSYYNNINFPFLWTGGDGEYFIPRGTPLVQIIPFRREDVHLEIGVTDDTRRKNTTAKLGTVMRNGYRSMFWSQRKEGAAED